MVDLAEHLANQFEAPEDDEARQRFSIDTDGKANWAFRKLAAAQARAAEVRRQADEQRALIAEWESAELEACSRDERMFEGALGDYWRRQLTAEVDELIGKGMTFDEAWSKVKSKSRKLAAGTLSATKGRESIVIEDDATHVAWAQEHGLYDLLSVTYKPSKDALSLLNRQDGAFVTPDGEKVPGVYVVEPGITYKAKPAT